MLRKRQVVKEFFAAVVFAFMMTGAATGTEEAQPAPNFTLKSLDGRDVTLDEFRGKYLLINFWATWCGPCKIEMPSLEALYQKFKDDGLALIGISNDMFGARVVKPYVEASKISFPVLLDQRLTVSYKFGVVNLPTTFLVNPKGEIIGILHGPEDWGKPATLRYFENLLKKG